MHYAAEYCVIEGRFCRTRLGYNQTSLMMQSDIYFQFETRDGNSDKF